MSVEAEVQRGWTEHGTDPEGVAARLAGLCEQAEAQDVPAVAGLVVHVLAEHLGRFSEADERLDALARLGDSDALLRCRAVLRLCRGELDPSGWPAAARAGETPAPTEFDPFGRPAAVLESFEHLLDAFGPGRASNEARILAVAAGVVAQHGRPSEASRWLVRAASLSYGLPDADPAVRVVAATANNVACALEERPTRSAEENSLLRSSSQLARAAWERAGTWREVERAEYRLTMTHLVLGEPLAAVAHALACRAICDGNDADAGERLFAVEALARSLAAAGDAEGARTAVEEARALLPSVPAGMARHAAEAVLKLQATGGVG